MNTAQIKAYAPKARNDFIKAVTERATRFGLHGDNKFDSMEFKGDVAIINTQVFTKKGGELRGKLVEKVQQQGFEMFIRSHAYTWFNRFVALRYMELHDFLDHGFRALSNPNGSDIPEILEHATEVDLPGLDKEKVMELRLAGDKDNELYRMLVIAQCNALHKAMPFLFEEIDNEAELLLPDNLLHTNSPVRKMVTEIDESLWTDVEIIGWIYQFYISEKKDEVIGKVVKSEDIPAATQLFTPNWIVKYMVQNTLGKMWMATYPDSSLKTKMEYYIEPVEQEPEVQEEIDRTTPKELNPEELTFLDPACGSGHILVEAYDILKEIYLERGYRTRDIPCLILGKNLYGLDIDDRAAQLACFVVLMRARKDDRRLFNRDDLNLNIMSIIETKGLEKSKLLEAVSKRKGGKSIWVWIHGLVELFEHAKTFGSLITISDELADKLNDIQSIIESERADRNDLFDFIAGEELNSLRPVVKQAKILARKYDCVVANPPYMGVKGMNPKLKEFGKDHFPDSKSDLFSIFIERNLEFLVKQGFVGMITMQSWMFLSSFEKLREKILIEKTISSMIHLGARAFDSIGGEVVSTTVFVLENVSKPNSQSSYFRLIDGKSEMEKKAAIREAIKNPVCGWFFDAAATDFKKIPGRPIAYWASDKQLNAFKNCRLLGDIASPKQGIATANNDLFLRRWYELSFSSIHLSLNNKEQAIEREAKWLPYNKGGNFRKWYGNNEFVINWENDGHEIRSFCDDSGKQRSAIRNPDYYFRPSATWTDISSSAFGVRRSGKGFLFDGSSHSAFSDPSNIDFIIGLLCANTSFEFLKIINPTMHFQVGNVASIPVAEKELKSKKVRIDEIVKSQVSNVKNDWDSYEISWDFTTLPLLHFEDYKPALKLTYTILRSNWKQMIFEIQRLEEENNCIFIEAYGLQDELSPVVSLPEITLTCNPHYRYGKGKTEEEYEALLLTDTIKELISYAIGCMLGRYSLDEPGLIYAHCDNIGFNPSKYEIFPADDDGIVPIMDMDWFEDDATRRFVEFVRTAWPSESLDGNLKFIAERLKPKTNESPEDTIRRYLSTTFFKDHMKIYKNRPIYWLFSSGKQKAFECLVYLHRYNDSTLSRMRSNYVTPLQGNMSARIEFLEHEKDATTTASTQKKIQKQIDTLKKKQVELKSFDDELRHYADMRISIDLDDGVKVNYGKFGNLLAEKKAITGEK